MGNFKTVGNIEGASSIGDKTASVFGVRDPMWHGCGTLFQDSPTFEEALVAMNGNFTYEKVQATYNHSDVPGHFWIVRKDKNLVVGHVGDKFHIIQRHDAYDILETIGGKVSLTSGGILGQGERDFISCKLPSTTKIAGDLIDHYFVLLNSYDGSSSLLTLITPIRPVCQNTINLGLEKAPRRFAVRHTRNYEAKLREATRVLGIVSDYYTTFDDICKMLLKKKFSEKAYGEMIDVLLKKPEEGASDRKQLLFEKQRDLMMQAYDAPDLANLDNTAYKAYNAIADYADHARLSRGEDENRKAANRFLRTFIETDLKDRAYDYLLVKAGR